MFDDYPMDEVAQLKPQTLTGYAESLNWVRVPFPKRPDLAVYHRPDSDRHQVTIPVDTGLDDYALAVVLAIRKLAKFEGKLPIDVIRELLAEQNRKATTPEPATP